MKRWLFVCLVLLPAAVSAQVVRDGSVGPSDAGLVAPGIDDLDQPATYLIHDGLGERAGQNLFHSFSRFDIGAGETATFTSGAAVPPANVLARVTGGQESRIHGQLRSTIPGADLWLINPAGWLFGAGSSLDVSGSLHVTSANHVRHGDSARFSSSPGAQSSLSVAPPEAFGFLDSGPGAIRIENTALKLRSGKTFSLVGGDIEIHGSSGAAPSEVLSVPSGRINLVAIGSPGEVLLDHSPTDPQMQVDAFPELGRIEVTGRARIDYSGDPGGTAVLRGGSLLVDESVLDGRTTGSREHPGVSLDLGVRGEITIRGRGTSVTGLPANPYVPDRYSQLVAGTTGSGRGGSIRVRGDTLRIEHRDPLGITPVLSCAIAGLGDKCSGVLSQSYASVTPAAPVGSPGDIDVAVRRIELLGAWATIRANRRAPSNASSGDIQITADELYLNEGASITTDALQRIMGGVLASQADAGNITIRTRLLETTGFSPFSANTLGSGTGGNISVYADRIYIQQPVTSTPGLPRLAGFRAQTFGSGDGGEIRIEAREMTIEGKVHVSTNSYDPAFFNVPSVDSERGDAGAVRIQVDDLRVLDGAVITSSTYGGGDAGTIEIRARGSVLVRGSGPHQPRENHLSAISTLSGRGEDLAKEFPEVLGARVRSNNPSGDAGDIFIEAEEVWVDGGTIISSTSSEGDAGDVTVRANRLIARSSPEFEVAIESESFRIEPKYVDSNEWLPYGHGAAGSVSLIGTGQDSELRVESSTISSRTGTPGSGGDLRVEFAHVILDDGQLSVASALYPGEHPAGSEAERAVKGDAGDLTLIARDELRLRNGGRITAHSVRSDGGNIEIQAGSAVELFDSSITAEVGGGPETTGGNISIDPRHVILEDGSVISANATQGQGGNVSIRTEVLLVSPDSRISASSQFGVSGRVNVDAPESSLSGDLASLSQPYLDAAALIGDRCAVGSGGGGSFAVRAGPGVRPAADGALASPLRFLRDSGLARAH